MSVHKVSRRVDTVIVEMDISTAEKLSEILFTVQDEARVGYESDMVDLNVMLNENADVRQPSPLYKADPRDGYVLVTSRYA